MTTVQWLVAITISLATIHLVLVWHITEQSDQLLLSALYWLAIIISFKQRLLRLGPSNHWIPHALGSLLIVFIIYRSLFVFLSESSFVRIFPSISVLGIVLLAAGFKFYTYWRECVLMGILALPPILTNQALEGLVGHHLQLIIAQIATFFIHYIGLEVTRQGTDIILERGAVSVAYGCTGGDILILLWQLCVPVVLLVPIPKPHRLGMPFGAIGLTLILASIRVSIMAFFVHQPALFEYWHGDAGNQIFSNVGIFVFGGVYWWITESYLRESANPIAQEP
ncbi:MAG: Transmembrane exosortase [Phormidesmis priestleyi Ana]|uniref:Transmembrane exosortase n=1 Tax=Phormidesmis priestleyi Ana TaxID=1666911 RepID=A0A0P7ZK14_9CYAN|nr:MAG: Transmembrane exosortase [Phormidesmis priestleyi Ana]